MSIAVGIDGCRAGWFWFRFDGPRGRFGVAADVAGLLAGPLAGDPGELTALIDIPIGLPQAGAGRACDRLARARLGARRTSVFPAPCRAVLAATDFADALARSRRQTDRGLSRQAWNLVPRIREVDTLLRATPALHGRLREAHPELVFAGLAGGPMAHAKRTRAGFAERLTLLSIVDGDAERWIAGAFLAHGGFEAGRDDIVDAFALALCAQRPEALRTLPEARALDAEGLPMEMVWLPGPGV